MNLDQTHIEDVYTIDLERTLKDLKQQVTSTFLAGVVAGVNNTDITIRMEDGMYHIISAKELVKVLNQ